MNKIDLQKQFFNNLFQWYTNLLKNYKSDLPELDFKVSYLIIYLLFSWLLKETKFLNPTYFTPTNLKFLLNNQQIDGHPEANIYKDDFRLFEKVPSIAAELDIPDKFFFCSEQGLFPLLENYQFILKEQNEIKETNYLDPEIVSIVFENLLDNFSSSNNTRKATGSFYTPYEIVDYMAEEAILADIQNKLGTEKDVEQLRTSLFSNGESDLNFQEKHKIVHIISQLKVLDPALGCGVFAIGVLNKLTTILEKIDPTLELWLNYQINLIDVDNTTQAKLAIDRVHKIFKNNSNPYIHKFFLIQNNIYGVDIQPLAILISKLRLVLALLSEQDLPKLTLNSFSFPNIEINFVCANTLLGPKKKITDSNQFLFELPSTVETQNIWLETDFFCNHHINNFFDSRWFFNLPKGFDLVIGNPPYLSFSLLDNKLRQQLKIDYGYTGDLYEYFIHKTELLVKNKGLVSFITPYNYTTFANKLLTRKIFLRNQLLNLTSVPKFTFEAVIDTVIFLFRKGKALVDHVYQYNALNEKQKKYQLSYNFIKRVPYQILILNKESSLIERLSDYPKSKEFCKVIADAGINPGNIRNKIYLEKEDKTRKVGKLLQGKQINRYILYWDSPKAKYKYCYLDYIPNKLLKGKTRKKESIKNEYWYLNTMKYHHYPERLLMRQTSDSLILVYQNERTDGIYYTDATLHTVFPITTKLDIKYLLALFNSKLLNYIYQYFSQEKKKHLAQVRINLVNELPIVVGTIEQQTKIVSLVNKILQKKEFSFDSNREVLQAKIDDLVYQIYGLDNNEIKEVSSIT